MRSERQRTKHSGRKVPAKRWTPQTRGESRGIEPVGDPDGYLDERFEHRTDRPPPSAIAGMTQEVLLEILQDQGLDRKGGGDRLGVSGCRGGIHTQPERGSVQVSALDAPPAVIASRLRLPRPRAALGGIQGCIEIRVGELARATVSRRGGGFVQGAAIGGHGCNGAPSVGDVAVGIKGKAAAVRLASDHAERKARTCLPFSKVMGPDQARTPVPFTAGAGRREIRGRLIRAGTESISSDDEEVFASVLTLCPID